MNDALKLEAERREWIGETLIWALEHESKPAIAEWIGWATSRLNEPWPR